MYCIPPVFFKKKILGKSSIKWDFFCCSFYFKASPAYILLYHFKGGLTCESLEIQTTIRISNTVKIHFYIRKSGFGIIFCQSHFCCCSWSNMQIDFCKRFLVWVLVHRLDHSILHQIFPEVRENWRALVITKYVKFLKYSEHHPSNVTHSILISKHLFVFAVFGIYAIYSAVFWIVSAVFKIQSIIVGFWYNYKLCMQVITALLKNTTVCIHYM